MNAQDWPKGLTLTWSSTGRWTYSVLDEHGLENTLVLPVPALAAPSAVSGALPALMDGRHGQLPASEERWEHAGLLESWAESAALYGDDKYDAAYQAAEEEAETFLRWQEQLDGEGAVAAEPGAGLSEDGGESAGLTRYRVLAMRTDEAHPGAATLTNYANARSVEEALAMVRRANERPGGLYGEQGLYRVVEVTEEGPAGEVLRREAARRTFVDVVMNAARAETSQDITGMPHPEMFGVLCDFFTRAIVFPGQFGFPSGSDPDDDQMHTSDPSRALSRLLLQHLTHHSLNLVQDPTEYSGSQGPGCQSTLVLSVDDPDQGVSTALEALAARAWHSYGITLHYTGEDDRNGAEATMEAMRHAVQAVAPGFTAATLVRLADDPQLGLTLDQRLYLDELAIALDPETLEAMEPTPAPARKGNDPARELPHAPGTQQRSRTPGGPVSDGRHQRPAARVRALGRPGRARERGGRPGGRAGGRSGRRGAERGRGAGRHGAALAWPGVRGRLG
ncbi:hypothetical protein [Streptomyces kasugaensis]|uniref:hypothetical protein n=1 Tax=Streptomyces kasugaensis TaxID=1946 RepID=UPI0013EF90E5|nr:hypothetical protein [Streptomyces kasugaensis]